MGMVIGPQVKIPMSMVESIPRDGMVAQQQQIKQPRAALMCKMHCGLNIKKYVDTIYGLEIFLNRITKKMQCG
jgi:hypothetical protein